MEAAAADLMRLIAGRDRFDRARTLMRRAELLWKHGEDARAIADYAEAFALDDALRRELLEEVRQGSGGDAAARRRELDLVLHFHPNAIDDRVERARLLMKEKRYAEARRDLDAAIEAGRSWVDPELLHQLGEDAKAIEDETRAIALDPWVPEYHAWRGLWRLWSEGGSPEAEADMRRAMELAPEDLVMSQLWAIYLRWEERHEEALDVHERRVASQPTFAFLRADLAEARLRVAQDEGTLRAALADFDAAIADEEEPEAELLAAREELWARIGAGGGAQKQISTDGAVG